MRTLKEFRFEKPMDRLPEIWMPAYRAKRYLANLDDEGLRRRGQDIFLNTMKLDDDRKLRPRFYVDEKGFYTADRGLDWMRLLTDFYTEMREFRVSPPDLSPRPGERLAPERMANEEWAWRPDLAAKGDNGYKYERPTILFKFGQREWNRKFLADGEVRICPASRYSDPSLNSAIRDEELSLDILDGRGNVSAFSVENYYVSCFAMAYDYRLYTDFDYDSCLVIHDVPVFKARLNRAMRTAADVKRMGSNPVIYFDPFAQHSFYGGITTEMPPVTEEIVFGKHFRYAYQREFRFVWMVRNPVDIFPLSLRLGNLEDIAELI
jgi:hypothetical protein